MITPNFFIAGAPKCGTTALYEYLQNQPDVYLPDFKEPKYFTSVQGEVDALHLLGKKVFDEPFSDKPLLSGNFKKGDDWYQTIFSGEHPRSQNAWSGEKRIGEGSTLYFYAPDAPKRIANTNKDARIMFMLRDPIDRVYSHYWHEHRGGFPESIFPDFATMLENNHPRLRFYKGVSSYKTHIQRFLEHFPQGQLMVFTLDELKSDSEGVLKTACDFLGVPCAVEPSGRTYNQNTERRFTRIQNAFHFCRWLYYEKMAQHVPEVIDRGLKPVKRLLVRCEHINRVPLDYPPMKPEWRERLLPCFEEDIDFVESFTGKDLSKWRKL